ncbi:XPGI domain-containing protein [Mycena indigotica]|uniref:XPGI domain-containing protein n=1 Tax=Mycena indigotica TaxID=2126181 RepID=A0A8H6T7P8_9AGAR|nr:XPGI domain-containing protein [Mycena indigotica]KAF7311872.1 XPGI domain-containing protein [Mycena indigotica]
MTTTLLTSLANALVDIFGKEVDGSALNTLLLQWTTDLRDWFRTNGQLAIAGNWPNTFPSIEVLTQLIKPAISVPLTTPSRPGYAANLTEIANQYRALFHEEPSTTMKSLENNLFGPYATHCMFYAGTMYNQGTFRTPTGSLTLTAPKSTTVPKTKHLKCPSHTDLIFTLRQLHYSYRASSVSVWVPAACIARFDLSGYLGTPKAAKTVPKDIVQVVTHSPSIEAASGVVRQHHRKRVRSPSIEIVESETWSQTADQSKLPALEKLSTKATPKKHRPARYPSSDSDIVIL